MPSKEVAIHDNNCGEVLDRYGYCYRCNFKPSADAVVIVDVPSQLAEVRQLRIRVKRLEQLEAAAKEWRTAWLPYHRPARRLASNDALKAAIDALTTETP